MERRIVVLVLMVVSIFYCCSFYPINNKNADDDRQRTLPAVHIEIIPRVELLAGVLSHTSWMGIRGPYGDGNKYFRELKQFLSPYADHRAVKIAQYLIERGFTHDMPINFMMRLSPLPELKVVHGYGRDLVRQAGNEKVLEEFRKALKNLSETSGFLDFYNSNIKRFYSCINTVSSEFDSKKIIGWLESFYGWKGSEYYVILAPAMFPGGGYGINIRKDSGEEIMVQVVRENGRSVGEPQFLKGRSLEVLALHEWGHAFANPVLEKHFRMINQLKPLYKKVEKTMKRHGYTTVQAFVNEQVVRAITALAVRELYGYFYYMDLVKREEQSGFYLTRYTVEKLEKYIGGRNRYPSFDLFVSYLLEQYYNDMEKLLKGEEEEELALATFIIIVLLLALVIFDRIKGFRRTITWV